MPNQSGPTEIKVQGQNCDLSSPCVQGWNQARFPHFVPQCGVAVKGGFSCQSLFCPFPSRESQLWLHCPLCFRLPSGNSHYQPNMVEASVAEFSAHYTTSGIRLCSALSRCACI
ncbi:hypothetical protein IF2G_00923 [Cordyceps javanica]|nr:hypothetical protein IF2G_00923 [Cordyceps javanica]